jgi:hypothetical protein
MVVHRLMTFGMSLVCEKPQVPEASKMTKLKPAKLYRYRSIDEHLKKLIVHRELYFSPPIRFNDPFDCRPVFDIKGTKLEARKYLQRLVSKHMPVLNRKQRQEEVCAILSDPSRNPLTAKGVASLQSGHTKRLTESVGVLCMSTVSDNILLWAHYADAHRGVCLIFDASMEFFNSAQKVRYDNFRPKINPIFDSEDSMFNSALLTKSSDWSYEEEWRLIRYQEGPGLCMFPCNALIGVILGAQVTPENELSVKEWISNSDAPIKLYRASLSNTEFCISVTSLS